MSPSTMQMSLSTIDGEIIRKHICDVAMSDILQFLLFAFLLGLATGYVVRELVSRRRRRRWRERNLL